MVELREARQVGDDTARGHRSSHRGLLQDQRRRRDGGLHERKVGRHAVTVCSLCSSSETRLRDAGGDPPHRQRGQNRRRLDGIAAAPVPTDARGVAAALL